MGPEARVEVLVERVDRAAAMGCMDTGARVGAGMAVAKAVVATGGADAHRLASHSWMKSMGRDTVDGSSPRP